MNKEHEILIIAKNTNGIVARIMSLFNRRGYFVNKMTAGVTNKPGYARLTLTVDGDSKSLDQIQKQVYKIVDVDRKSTRLNSSHQTISYAVFCLKKKKRGRFSA